MAKRKTSIKQKEFLKKKRFTFDIDDSKFEERKPLVYLCDEQNFMDVILECIEKEDLDALIEVTEIHLWSLQQKALMEEKNSVRSEKPKINKVVLLKSIERLLLLDSRR